MTPAGSCLRIRLAPLGMPISKSLRRSRSFGMAKSTSGTLPRGLPVALHRRHLGRLMLERVQAMHVTDEDLHGDQRGREERHRSARPP